MTILHGDDRIYNNIFVQNQPVADPEKQPTDSDYSVVGTAPFDIFPTYDEWISHFQMDQLPNMRELAQYHFGHLPVWVDGNAYFNGATICKHEQHYFAAPEDTRVHVGLAERDGKLYLDTDVFDHLKTFQDGLISSDLLGYAFEPEQRFENPDGSSILFDRDFFGNHRGVKTIPGPVTGIQATEAALW